MAGLDPGAQELAAARSRFDVVTSDWGLSPSEVAALLGLPPEASLAVDGGSLAVDAETRMRLFVEVARLLEKVIGPDLLEWLRDDEDGEVTPLAFMSRGVVELRAMRAAASARL